MKTDIDKAKFDLDNAFTSGDYEKASLIKYKKIPELEKQLQEIENNQKDGRILSEVVTEEEIAKIVSKLTNIPVSKISQGDKEKVLHLKEILGKRE